MNRVNPNFPINITYTFTCSLCEKVNAVTDTIIDSFKSTVAYEYNNGFDRISSSHECKHCKSFNIVDVIRPMYLDESNRESKKK